MRLATFKEIKIKMGKREKTIPQGRISRFRKERALEINKANKAETEIYTEEEWNESLRKKVIAEMKKAAAENKGKNK